MTPINAPSAMMATPAKPMTSLMMKIISWVSTDSTVAAPPVLLTPCQELAGGPSTHMGFPVRDQSRPSRLRPIGSHYRNWMRRETAAAGRDESVAQQPELNAFGRDYARLSFAIERHVPGLIDAYLGPEDARATLDPEQMAIPSALLTTARDLLARIPELDATEGRKGYLTKQVEAMLATARRVAGEELPYREEVRLLFDIEPVATPESVYDAAIADLDTLLPGDGPIAERMVAWRQSYTIPPETARRLVDVILPELRARTQEFVDLPADEMIEIRMVQDQPWSGYNCYLGNGRSRVDLNTDLPIYAYRLTDLLAHEGYPGHHTEHALKERLYTEIGRASCRASARSRDARERVAYYEE